MAIDLSPIREKNKTPKELKDFYTAQIKASLQKNSYSNVTDEQIEKIIISLSHLFPQFGRGIGNIYSLGGKGNHQGNISENIVNKLLSEWAQ